MKRAERGRGGFPERAATDYRAARDEVDAASRALLALPADAPPLVVAAAADRLESAAGALWMHAHRVAETHPT